MRPSVTRAPPHYLERTAVVDDLRGQDLDLPRLWPGIHVHSWRARVLRLARPDERAGALPRVPRRGQGGAGGADARSTGDVHRDLRGMRRAGPPAVPATPG